MADREKRENFKGQELNEQELDAVVGGVSMMADESTGEWYVMRRCSRCGECFSANARKFSDALCSKCKDYKVPLYMQT